MLEQAVHDGQDMEAPMKLAVLQNEIAQAHFEIAQEVPIELNDSEKTQCSNAWRTCRERNSSLIKNRGQVFSLIMGQCAQLLQDRMKQDPDWKTASASNDPLTLCRLIEKTILVQMEDQHPFATVCDQEMALCGFHQEKLTNAQWHECFNTKVDVGEAIGVTRQHEVLLEHVAQELHADSFDKLTDEQKAAVRANAEERHPSHIFLRQSGKQHANLRMDLQNDCATGDNGCPKTRQGTLHLLDKCSKTVFAVRVGVPFVEIVRYARENEVDFVVMGASGSSELDKQTFGSTVENVARRAHCHVMAIRNPEIAFKLPG